MYITNKGLKYLTKNNRAICVGFEDKKFSQVNIPEMVEGYVVTEIGENAFERTASITSLSIPKTITKIGKAAFYNCVGLKSVEMIGQNKAACIVSRYAFAFCGELELFDIFAPLHIEQQAFMHCRKLTFATSPIVYVGRSAFAECYKLDKMFFANDVVFERQALANSKINTVSFLGDAIFAGDFLETIIDSETKIYCEKNSNISEAPYYGASVYFF